MRNLFQVWMTLDYIFYHFSAAFHFPANFVKNSRWNRKLFFAFIYFYSTLWSFIQSIKTYCILSLLFYPIIAIFLLSIFILMLNLRSFICYIIITYILFCILIHFPIYLIILMLFHNFLYRIAYLILLDALNLFLWFIFLLLNRLHTFLFSYWDRHYILLNSSIANILCLVFHLMLL